MKWEKWLENWDMKSLKIKTGFLEMDFSPREADKDAAWELYVELLTRVSTQTLESGQGDEKTALTSIFNIFGLTRDIIKSHGRDCMEFTKIAIIVLNQVIRPFTAKWHKKSLEGAFKKSAECERFREELAELQEKLWRYTGMLGEMAGVEKIHDLRNMEDTTVE